MPLITDTRYIPAAELTPKIRAQRPGNTKPDLVPGIHATVLCRQRLIPGTQPPVNCPVQIALSRNG